MSAATLPFSGLFATQESQVLSSLKEELERAQLGFCQLMNASFDGVCVTEHGMITEANPQLGELFGRPAGELKGRHVLDLCAPEQRGLLRKAVRDGAAEPLEIWGMHASGEKILVQVSAWQSPFHRRERQVLVLRAA